MLQPTSESLPAAAAAAARLIGFYPTITASDPTIYATGLVQVFSRYPAHLVTAAVDPVTGLPSLHDFPPTMKQVRDFLEPRWQDECRIRQRIAEANRQRLPEPPPDPEADRRIREGLERLSEYLKGASSGPTARVANAGAHADAG